MLTPHYVFSVQVYICFHLQCSSISTALPWENLNFLTHHCPYIWAAGISTTSRWLRTTETDFSKLWGCHLGGGPMRKEGPLPGSQQLLLAEPQVLEAASMRALAPSRAEHCPRLSSMGVRISIHELGRRAPAFQS